MVACLPRTHWEEFSLQASDVHPLVLQDFALQGLKEFDQKAKKLGKKADKVNRTKWRRLQPKQPLRETIMEWLGHD